MKNYFPAVATVVVAAFAATAAEAREACIKTSTGEVVCGRQTGGKGSVYDSFGKQTVFVRGGYVLLSHGDLTPDGSNTPIFSVGWRRNWWGDFQFESEIVYTRDAELAFIGAGDADVSRLGIVGLLGIRWEGPQLWWGLDPFISGGFGPSYYRFAFDDGVSQISSGEVGLGYSGRAGVEKQLFSRFSLEAAYRYLNATSDAAVGQHSAELGLNYNF